jgi:hypothetical protein
MNNPTKGSFLPVTDSGPRPGDFPLKSSASRAAARILAGRKGDRLQRVEIILSPGMTDATEPSATPWLESVFGSGPLAGKLVRTLSVPLGMSPDEARRTVDYRV